MHRSLSVLASAAVAVSAAACGLPMGRLNAEARDTWTHSYPFGKSGEVSIANVNGRIDVEASEGSTVEVRAERVARAATEQMAKQLLPNIPINDRSTPDRVSVETGRVNGILIGASYTVDYHVTAPKAAAVRATTVNGRILIRGFAGRITAQATNGLIETKDVTGGLEARNVNGGVRAEFSSLGAGDVNLATVNGGVRIVLPEKAKATVNATWVNGGFSSPGLTFDVRESGRRHFEGQLNGGGTSITATTVNGGIRVATAAAAGADAGADVDVPKTRDRVAP